MRRFSQALSEGDGISLIAEVGSVDGARSAESAGAEGLLVRGEVGGLPEATELPVLWCGPGRPSEAARAGADACLVSVDGDEEDGRLRELHAEAVELGLDCVVAVRDEDELQLALDLVEPEVFLLAGRRSDDGGPLKHVLALLADVPAGKLAVADAQVTSRDEVDELERAGVDGVVLPAGAVAALAGAAAGEG
jgi:NAD(P)H-dependent flavin oxidoreductase YrpB (nitropropane dioxygenase family)